VAHPFRLGRCSKVGSGYTSRDGSRLSEAAAAGPKQAVAPRRITSFLMLSLPSGRSHARHRTFRNRWRTARRTCFSMSSQGIGESFQSRQEIHGRVVANAAKCT
jgi:hypothetical protein